MITAQLVHTISAVVSSSGPPLSKQPTLLIGSAITLLTNGTSLTTHTLLPDLTVEVGALPAVVTVTVEDQIAINSLLRKWIAFIRAERAVPELPALRHNQDIKFKQDSKDLQFIFSFFNPGVPKVMDAEWHQTAATLTVQPRSAITLVWGDFVFWQSFMNHCTSIMSGTAQFMG